MRNTASFVEQNQSVQQAESFCGLIFGTREDGSVKGIQDLTQEQLIAHTANLFGVNLNEKEDTSVRSNEQ